MSKEEILKKILSNKAKIKDFGVKKIGLFGSYANGTQKDNSDIDFLVDFNHKNFDNYMDLKFFMEGLFNKKVDLVISNSLKHRLKPLILKRVIYAKGL